MKKLLAYLSLISGENGLGNIVVTTIVFSDNLTNAKKISYDWFEEENPDTYNIKVSQCQVLHFHGQDIRLENGIPTLYK